MAGRVMHWRCLSVGGHVIFVVMDAREGQEGGMVDMREWERLAG